MTNKKASEILYDQWQSFLEKNLDYGGVSEAYKKAFKALEQEPFMNKPCVAHQVCHEDKVKVLDKIKDYVDHIRNTGMGKKKSLEFIEKFIEGLKEESEG